jgi:phosphotransferase system  glucose/maltose/N-acetylglucosamine-specific IIC component
MIPVAVLPAAGLLLGIGGGLLAGVEQGVYQISNPFVLNLLTIMKAAGDAVFGALPLLFAIGVVIAFTNNDGVSAIAATVGYVVLLGTMSAVAPIFGIETRTVLGFNTVDTGVFGGISGLTPPSCSTASSASSCRPTWASSPASVSCPSPPHSWPSPWASRWRSFGARSRVPSMHWATGPSPRTPP